MNQKSMPNKWLMFFILLISAITVSLSQLKISPVMGDVAAMLSVDANQASLLMSLFTVAGIFLSIPGAAVLAKTGSKNMLLILMGTLVLGNVLGAVTNSFAVVMISRIIEGLSYALIITVGIDMINTWFTGATVGTATGIFNTFAAAANFIGMNASVALYKGTGNLKTLWWAIAILAAVCSCWSSWSSRRPRLRPPAACPRRAPPWARPSRTPLCWSPACPCSAWRSCSSASSPATPPSSRPTALISSPPLSTPA